MLNYVLLNKFHSKAAEFERLLQSKSAASNISDAAKVVICLDLAASFFHSDLEVVRIILEFKQRLLLNCYLAISPI